MGRERFFPVYGAVDSPSPRRTTSRTETDKGRPVRHAHRAGGCSEEDQRASEDWFAQEYPDAERVSHPTRAFNGFSLAFDRAQSWLDTVDLESATELIESLLEDNGYQKRGKVGRFCCVILCRDAAGNVTHAGLVLEVDGAGNPTLIQSKCGEAGQSRHHPDQSPYGAGWEVWCK